MPASSSRTTGKSGGSVSSLNSASTPAPRLNAARRPSSRSNNSAGGFQTTASSACWTGWLACHATTSASGKAACKGSVHSRGSMALQEA
ncbi:Uncharacterised protein [Bordetella pertussis]|nr:Uncharacterised protein [Bordetella pertussis]